jgi:hypothetical protein
VQIGEIASPATGNTNLLGRVSRLLKQQHPMSALAGDSRAHQTRSPGTEYDDVMEVQVRIAIPRVLI